MFMTDINNIKIYNLSAGKSVPEWLTDQKKKSQLKNKLDSRRQIELIQDFNMPAVSTSIRMTPDNEYIVACGTYKPRVKCYEVCNLSIKFERCFDSEVACLEVLSEDYSKMVFLQCDRYIELHTSQGRHFRLRIPKFGRDMKYHKETADLLIGANSSDIYRLNLERGQFLQSYESEGSCVNALAINNEHGLICSGTEEGTVEAWDYRDRKKVATLDVAVNLLNTKEFPSISALHFKNALTLGVGTKSGHVLLFDIRSKTPKLIKDQLNKLPVKRIDFNANTGNVYSLDSAMLKIWDENNGKQLTYIESTSHFNDFCTIPGTGLFFLAQEDVKMLTYYIPAMGPAPKWCSFLDNVAEEIESEVVEHIYDDYRFVTTKELEELGLDNLIGTNLLRAYMHGYFIDYRLYQKARSIVEPTSYENYKANKVRKELEAQRPSRLQLANLPKINQELALKIIEDRMNANGKEKKMPSLLEDNRFKQLFESSDFKIDYNAPEYKMLAPALNRLKKSKLKEIKQRIESARVLELQAEEEERKERESDNDDDLFGDSNAQRSSEEEESSDEDIKEYSKEMRQAYKEIKKDQARKADEEEENDIDNNNEMEDGDQIKSLSKMVALHTEADFKVDAHKKKISKISFEKLLQKQSNKLDDDVSNGRFGNKQLTFSTKKVTKEMKKREYELKKHRDERKRIVRPTNKLKLKKINFK
ncbi:nucleolar protein 10 [Condylostylus longicornis]|uniref:nucleolar protein 10 n=1 Tax=Condylostylus longicornis TaxID=2530218 RepID=UPI00244E1E04|nr:nucleolar protein 10 [Condylostylus longicornis]